MDKQNNFQQIEHKESQAVISFSNRTTFKISLLVDKINDFFIKSVLKNLVEQLKENGLGIPPNHYGNCENWSYGVPSEILEPKSGKWQKGKMRLRVILEFCPDEPEEIEDTNSLDDIRKTIS